MTSAAHDGAPLPARFAYHQKVEQNINFSRIIGTAALTDPEFVRDMAKPYEGGIVVAVDARDGMVATEGWADVSDVRVEDLARRFEDAGVTDFNAAIMDVEEGAYDRTLDFLSSMK